jgi:hypothetical protein
MSELACWRQLTFTATLFSGFHDSPKPKIQTWGIRILVSKQGNGSRIERLRYLVGDAIESVGRFPVLLVGEYNHSHVQLGESHANTQEAGCASILPNAPIGSRLDNLPIQTD